MSRAGSDLESPPNADTAMGSAPPNEDPAARADPVEGAGNIGDTRRRRFRGAKWVVVAVAVVVAAAVVVGSVVIGRHAPVRVAHVSFTDRRVLPAQQWTITTGHWRQGGGTASIASTAPGWTLAAVVRGVADGDVKASVDATGTGAGLAFRVRDDANFWAVTSAPAYGTWNISKVVGGTIEYVANTGLSVVRGKHIVEARLKGTFIDLFIDGHGVASIEDPTLQAATGAGFVLLGSRNPRLALWADFSATTRTTGSSLDRARGS